MQVSTHLLGDDIVVVTVEDVLLELGHRLLGALDTGHGEQEEPTQERSLHPDNTDED